MFALTFPRHQRINGNKVGRWCQTFRSELAPLKPAKLAKVSGILTQIPRQQLRLVSGVQTSGKVSAAVYLGRPKHKRNWRTSRSGGRAVAARLVFWKSYVNIVDHAKFEVRSFSMFFFLFWSVGCSVRTFLSWVGLDILGLTKTSGQEIPSLGSYGHPNICRRPCILLVKGTCQKGSACGFCHLEHDAQRNSSEAVLWFLLFFPMYFPQILDNLAANQIRNCALLLSTSSRETTWSSCHARSSWRWFYRMCARRWRLGDYSGC